MSVNVTRGPLFANRNYPASPQLSPYPQATLNLNVVNIWTQGRLFMLWPWPWPWPILLVLLDPQNETLTILLIQRHGVMSRQTWISCLGIGCQSFDVCPTVSVAEMVCLCDTMCTIYRLGLDLALRGERQAIATSQFVFYPSWKWTASLGGGGKLLYHCIASLKTNQLMLSNE